MRVLETFDHLFTSLSELLGLAWWVEIITVGPNCTYYFGPFATAKAAEHSQFGYIEDLAQEDAQIASVQIRRHQQPKWLTIPEDSWSGV